MTATREYTRLHDALARTADQFAVTPFVVRTLVAVADRGGTATSHELGEDLACGGSMVRRALLAAYDRGLASGLADIGGPRRPGQVTRVSLTPGGRTIIREFRRRVAADREAQAA